MLRVDLALMWWQQMPFEKVTTSLGSGMNSAAKLSSSRSRRDELLARHRSGIAIKDLAIDINLSYGRTLQLIRYAEKQERWRPR